MNMPKRQKVHATIELILRNEKIGHEEKILRKLKLAVRQGIPSGHSHLKDAVRPALYTQFRGKGFPLKSLNNRKLPEWRSLSHWMGAQIIAMAIGQFEHRQFRVRLHDDVRLREEAKGTDLKVYLRDRITRILGEGYEEDPWYLFVIEDLDTDGKSFVRPHAHGVVRIRPLPLRNIRNKRSRAAYQQTAVSAGLEKAELRAGLAAMRRLLKQATGNDINARRIVNGVSQDGNVWMRKSYHRYFNDEAISYAFKNADSPSSNLPSNRLAISQAARAEGKKLWELIRRGEQALEQWN
ncbi:hypothetical protein [uncultured Erythrobacter sp.]|uniref:hypothetical protein n=1 Tax=uncultured Erythrobacter sp. TaxID=263913 RepID=UPI002616D3A7|nr:hypothetical protein [uncultured Erythrobacter sp.]